jgi:hypothetical protein
MDVGLETRVDRSTRLMALAVRRVVKTNEGRKAGQSFLPFTQTSRKLWWIAVNQDDL